MAPLASTALYHFLQRKQLPGLDKLQAIPVAMSAQDVASVIAIYKESMPLLEQAIWSRQGDGDELACYQQVCRELEDYITLQGHDDRHHMVLFIPVADRPLQLNVCLNSLLELCRLYRYGGHENNRYTKITVLIADDSKDATSIIKHKQLTQQFNAQGLATQYFGMDEQLAQIESLTELGRQGLQGFLAGTDPAAFYHKGAARMRNLAYLKLNALAKEHDRVLFYSLDSDQEFRVKISTGQGDRDLYAVNYFYYLNEIFTNTNTCLLTGKVVGDPPVSPAVMAGNFLEDILSFVEQMTRLAPREACQFHQHQQQKTDDAAYHDMAEMFGFKRAAHSYHYQCPLSGEHDNAQSFNHFASRLNQFFYGEHPTRKTWYEYTDVNASLAPARTVYTGNYIFNEQGLKYFIPFAPLKLRMNGPVLGRIIKSELKDRFVSANLPMLHKRTFEDSGQSEFRPGINQTQQRVDMADEFERQYFGDVMLFSMEKLTGQGYPVQTLSRDSVLETVKATEQTINRQYLAKHKEILLKLGRLNALLNDAHHWWNRSTEFEIANADLAAFADNIEHNFGDNSACYRLMNSPADKQSRLMQIVDAILQYPADQLAWEHVLSHEQTVLNRHE